MSSIDLTVTPFDKVTYLSGEADICNEPLSPYDNDICMFLTELSSNLIKDPQAHEYPDVISFAYWCRKANIQRLKAQANQGRFPLSTRLGRGLAFHIAPSNIPVNFAFSFVFGLLAGNANIVRVPSKPFSQTRIICGCISSIITSYPSLAQRNVFVSYPADDEITSAFCAVSDARIIWGGDKTVSTVKSYPAHPRCKDIVFPDRYSVALIKGEAIRIASEDELAKLADSFYNDTYLMDQNACSSPQMVFWQSATAEDRSRFWSAVKKAASRRYYLQPVIVMDKYTQYCEDIIDGLVKEKNDFDGIVTVVDIDMLPSDICGMRGKGGYFYEHEIESLTELCPLINERYQTLLYHGYEPEELRRMVIDNHLRGIDRIVKIGSAMDIDVFWDGYDLVTELSRIVDAR